MEKSSIITGRGSTGTQALAEPLVVGTLKKLDFESVIFRGKRDREK
jgi:hypothetical protein